MARIMVLRSCFLVLVLLGVSHAACAGPYQHSYLMDKLLLPATSTEASDYAIDLNGDGVADNRFGNLLANLVAGMGLDIDTMTNAAIMDGSVVHLINLQSSDAAFANDPAAQAGWCVGLPLPQPPLFDGTDQPACDNEQIPGIFSAALSGGSFTSPDPATTDSPVDVTLVLQFGPDVVALPLQGARLSFTIDSANPGRMQGQLNGSIRHDDLALLVDPAFADLFNSLIQNNPGSDTATALKDLFDTGCGDDDDGADDGLIEVCEVLENNLLQSLLAPDVQIRDAMGNYAPNPANTTPDADSIGVRFTAVLRDRLFSDGFDL